MRASVTSTTANKTDAGNGSKAICRVSNVHPSPSPDPGHKWGQVPDFNKGYKLEWLVVALGIVISDIPLLSEHT